MGKQDHSLEKHFAAFKFNARKQLQAISSGLRALARNPSPDERVRLVEDIFRQTHNLKRAARMTLRDVEAICQSMENILARLKKGELTATPELFDALHKAVDAIRYLLDLGSNRKSKCNYITRIMKLLVRFSGKALGHSFRVLSPHNNGNFFKKASKHPGVNRESASSRPGNRQDLAGRNAGTRNVIGRMLNNLGHTNGSKSTKGVSTA